MRGMRAEMTTMGEALNAVPATAPAFASPRPLTRDVVIDLTHLGRHVTGIERVSIEQFEKVAFEGTRVRHVRAHGLLSMIWHQQVVLPVLAALNPRATFVFPGFPPSPLFVFARNRVVMYVHDLFLLTRRPDLGIKAKAYMTTPFGIAVTYLKHFLVNSEKTSAELQPFVTGDAQIALYRPMLRNVFDLEAGDRGDRPARPQVLKFVTLGTVEPRKNYGAMLPILDTLTARGIACELHVIGREGWGEASASLKGDPRVTIHGYQPSERVKALLEAADVYLCTSHDEGLGLPLLEAQFAGLVVVAPDKTVFREVLASSAIFIDTAAPSEAASAVEAVISNPNWRSTTTATALANVARWNALAAVDAAVAQTMFAAQTLPSVA